MLYIMKNTYINGSLCYAVLISLKKSFLLSILLSLIFSSTTSAQYNWNNDPDSDIVELPFEPSQRNFLTVDTVYSFSPWLILEELADNAIVWYQHDISPSSIDRCPFLISCSNYARKAIATHGLLKGLCLFIDRNLYRENIEMFRLYTLIQKQNGILKLDDSFFLAEDQ